MSDATVDAVRHSTADLSTILPRLRNTLKRKGAIGHVWDRCDEHTRLLWCALARIDLEFGPRLIWHELPAEAQLNLSHAAGVVFNFLRHLAELPRG